MRRSAARPWVLRTVKLPPGGFAELARRSPLGAGAEAQLRLINGVYGLGAGDAVDPANVPTTGLPRIGDLVKVVE